MMIRKRITYVTTHSFRRHHHQKLALKGKFVHPASEGKIDEYKICQYDPTPPWKWSEMIVLVILLLVLSWRICTPNRHHLKSSCNGYMICTGADMCEPMISDIWEMWRWVAFCSNEWQTNQKIRTQQGQNVYFSINSCATEWRSRS